MTCRPVNINIIATELRDLRPGVERSLCFQSGFQFTVQLTIIIKSYDLHQTRGPTWHYQAMYLTASKGNEVCMGYAKQLVCVLVRGKKSIYTNKFPIYIKPQAYFVSFKTNDHGRQR